MEQIVKPSMFYWAQVFGTVKVLSAIVAMLSIVIIAILLVAYFDNYIGWDDEDDDAAMMRKTIKIVAIIVLILLPIIIFTPSKETLIKMQIARLATGDNVEMVLQRITEVAKEIIGGK